MGLLAQSPPLLSRKKWMEIEDVVSVIRAREGAVRGSGPVAGGLGEGRLPLLSQCRQDLR